jgi:hypothetical protein
MPTSFLGIWIGTLDEEPHGDRALVAPWLGANAALIDYLTAVVSAHPDKRRLHHFDSFGAGRSATSPTRRSSPYGIKGAMCGGKPSRQGPPATQNA